MRTQWTSKENRDAGSSCSCDRGLRWYLWNFGRGWRFEHPKPPLTVRHCSQASYAVGKQRNTQILVYLPVTYVPGGTTCKAKTLLFTRVYAQGATCIQTRPRVQLPNRILHIRPMPSIVVKTCSHAYDHYVIESDSAHSSRNHNLAWC